MSNNTSKYQEYTFKELLDQYDRILVPMIQRDYAQGRTGKKATDVRNNLLTDIFSDKDVHFDLVFGSKEKRIIDGKEMNCFIPVDGQQRLTTLFLLFLYGLKAGKTNIELDLSKFSYDTRRAASDFCESITSVEWTVQEDKKVSDVIKDSSWFMNYWEKDPTVEGMLNMLDAIHEKCKEITDYPNLNKVTFFFFDLESNGLNENLYLKMNSRGKPLTAFENLKAKMEKVLPEDVEIEDKCFPKCDASSKDSFKAKWKYFMDRDWINAFWNSEKPEETDINITAFIVRFLSGYYNAFNEDNNENNISEELKEINNKENYADFIPFEPIEKILKLKKTFQTLAYALTIIPSIFQYWSEDPIKITEKSEYKFLAVIFSYVLFDGDKSAMRFAWNMSENYVTGYDNFIKYCQLVKKIHDKFDLNVNNAFYKILSDNSFDNSSEQLNEEIAKAQQILNGSPRQDGKNWENIIFEVETYKFFKGSIRFLFTKEKIGDDWGNFDTKWINAQKYFDENGVKDGKEKYNSNTLLIRSLLANGDWNNIWWYFEFSNDASRWKRMLISNNWRNAVDAIMREEVTTETTEKSIESITEPFIKNIVDDGLMDYVCKEMSGAWIRGTYHGYHAIWKSRNPASQVVLNPILAQLNVDKKIYYSSDNVIENCRYYKCKDKNVDFKYGGYYFRWFGNSNDKELDVYLMEENWKDYKKRTNPTTEKNTDEDTHYCFRVTSKMETGISLFEDKLKALIDEAANNGDLQSTREQ